MNKVTKKELVERANEHERRIHRIERLFKKNGLEFDLPELPKTGDFFEIVQHHSRTLRKGMVLEVAKVNHNTNLIKFVGGFNGYFTDFDRSVYLSGAEDEPMKPCAKPEEAEPKLKVLDQLVFDGLDEKWRFAMVSSVGIPFVYDYKPTGKRVFFSDDSTQQKISAGKVMRIDEYDYDTTDWQNSLIERDKVELTGSDLCRAMLARGDRYVLCFVSDFSDEYAANQAQRINLVTHTEGNSICAKSARWKYAVPFNQQTGEPLTASEVGL